MLPRYLKDGTPDSSGRLLSSDGHPGIYTIMKLSEDVDELVRESKSEEDVPQEVSLHSVKGFGEIDKGHKQILVLFPALFLKLPGCEDHVDCTPVLPKAAP